MTHKRRDRRGTNALEFALVLPVFVAIMTGMFEFSYVFYTRANIIGATAAGCRSGAVIDLAIEGEAIATETSRSAIETAMQAWDFDCSSSSTSCTIDVSIDGSIPYKKILCSVEVNYESLTGTNAMDSVLPSTLDAASTTYMEIQREDNN